jgi:hypothetical protein
MLFAQHYELPWWVLLVCFIGILFIALILRQCEPGFAERAMKKSGAARGMGLALIIAGTIMGLFTIYEPIVQGRIHEQFIRIRYGGVCFSALALIFGFLYLIAGKNISKFVIMRQGQQMNSFQRTTLYLIVAICIGLEVSFHLLIHYWGYHRAW